MLSNKNKHHLSKVRVSDTSVPFDSLLIKKTRCTHYLIDELEPPVIKKDLFLSKCECGIFGNGFKEMSLERVRRFVGILSHSEQFMLSGLAGCSTCSLGSLGGEL